MVFNHWLEQISSQLNHLAKISSGLSNQIALEPDATVLELKRGIAAETQVQPKRQKLLNLKQGKAMAGDEVALADLKLKPNFKVMMMGSPEEAIQEAAHAAETAPTVNDDFDIGVDEPIDIKDKGENIAKMEKRIEKQQLKILNPPRPGKKLLVLDIDYTLFDHRSEAENALELMRPFLHEFLTASYEHYDIIIWSATSLKWIEVKMEALGVLSNTNYKIVTLVDYQCMITVYSEKYGSIDCKPLGVIWGKFPEYNDKNTIMFDDLRRNFLMNPQNGLQIRPFRDAHINMATDRELEHLTKYLLEIAKLDDISDLDHKHWGRYLRRRVRGESES